MKKVILLLIILLMSTSLSGVDISASFSLRTANESDLLDYEFASSFNYKDNIEAELAYERENGKDYLNYEIKLIQAWRHLSLSTQRKYIECKDIDNIYIEALGRYFVEQERWNFWLVKFVSDGYWEAGLRQAWDTGKPSTNIVLGKTYDKELKFFLTPAKFQYSLFYYSSDFKKWDCESSVEVSFSILANLDFYLKYILEPKYFQMKTGLTLHI